MSEDAVEADIQQVGERLDTTRRFGSSLIGLPLDEARRRAEEHGLRVRVITTHPAAVDAGVALDRVTFDVREGMVVAVSAG